MTSTILESDGTAALLQDDATGVYSIQPLDGLGDPVGDPIVITREGKGEISDTSYAGWTITAVEAGAESGFRVLFQNVDGRSLIWNVDDTGAYVDEDSLIGVDQETLRLAEIEFGVDGLDDVEGSGVEPGPGAVTTVESTGTAALLQDDATGVYSIQPLDGLGDPIGDPIVITREGKGEISDTSYAGWTITAVEAGTESGFRVLFQKTDGSNLIWNVDDTGAFVSQDSLIGADQETLRLAEIEFSVDGLDDIEGIGVEPDPLTTLESTGTAALLQNGTTGVYSIQPLDGLGDPVGDPIVITREGVGEVSDTSYAGWTITAVEVDPEDSSAYVVLFENPEQGAVIWSVNSAGAYTGEVTLIGADGPTLRAAEILFDTDGLDSTTGIGHELIEELGTVSLTEAPSGQYFVEDAGGQLGLAVDPGTGAVAISSELASSVDDPDQFVWTAVEAVADEDGVGYQLLWEISAVSDGAVLGTDIWTFDEQGMFQADSGNILLFEYSDSLA